MTNTELFLELAQPDENGCSRWVNVTEEAGVEEAPLWQKNTSLNLISQRQRAILLMLYVLLGLIMKNILVKTYVKTPETTIKTKIA